ncbi:MAG: hypothetical protein PHN19_00030 [Patescibacteria group bacterium]|nr:hypothetical protein [Patescibacteria group bacterium]
MQLPRDSKKLDIIFQSAGFSELNDFVGQYKVNMLTRLPNFKSLSHRKSFYRQDNKIYGHNIFFKNYIWGKFALEQEKDKVIIDYHQGHNTFISDNMIDLVRCIEKGKLYLGRFNLKFGNKLFFLGYFTLTKI